MSNNNTTQWNSYQQQCFPNNQHYVQQNSDLSDYTTYSYPQHQPMPAAYPLSQQNAPSPQPPAYPVFSGATTSYPTASSMHNQQNNYFANISHSSHQNSYYNQNRPPPPPPPPPKNVQEQPTNIDMSYCDPEPSNKASYSCVACSISFPTPSALVAHKKSHIQCKKCSFTGSKKVVGAHYKSKHGEYAGRGLKTVYIQHPGSRQTQRFKICVGDHPDDIKAWIEERKKRFPTRQKVLKKQEKRKRLLEEGAIRDTNIRTMDTKKPKIQIEEVPDRKPENSISTLIAGYGSSSDEDESNVEVESKPGRDVCHEVGDDETKPNTMKGEESLSKYKTKPCRFFLRNGKCKNWETCNYVHDLKQHEEFKANAESRKQKQRERDRARNKAKREMNLITTGREESSRSSQCGQTLLRKLLQNDIRRERSLTLQLLRYIVDCNFLQEKKEVEPNDDI